VGTAEEASFLGKKCVLVFWGGRSEIRGEILREVEIAGWRPKRAPLHGLGGSFGGEGNFRQG